MLRLSDATIKELVTLRRVCYDEAEHMNTCGLTDTDSWYELAAHVSAIVKYQRDGITEAPCSQ